jgi:hypothetical protein
VAKADAKGRGAENKTVKIDNFFAELKDLAITLTENQLSGNLAP